jgi:hypothetical protein
MINFFFYHQMVVPKDEQLIPVSEPRESCSACRCLVEKLPSSTSVVRYPTQGARPITACRFTIKHSREIILSVGPTSYNTEQVTSAFKDTLNKVNTFLIYTCKYRSTRSYIIHRIIYIFTFFYRLQVLEDFRLVHD